MPGSTPATSQLEWLSSTTAMIVLFWSRATRDLLRPFGWGIAGTPSIRYSDEVAIPRRPPHSVSRSPISRLTQTRSNGDVQHPCAAVGHARLAHPTIRADDRPYRRR